MNFPSDDGWHQTLPDDGMVVIAAGFPTIDRGKLPQDHPAGPFVLGGVVTDCSEHGAHPIAIAFPLREAGRFIAAMQEWAARNGLEYALQSATDQGRAWARQAPR